MDTVRKRSESVIHRRQNPLDSFGQSALYTLSVVALLSRCLHVGPCCSEYYNARCHGDAVPRCTEFVTPLSSDYEVVGPGAAGSSRSVCFRISAECAPSVPLARSYRGMLLLTPYSAEWLV
jgi:hypothetical protein